MATTGAGEVVLRPTSQDARIGSLDLMRGCALLGILVVNIQGVAMISATYNNPTAFGLLEGAEYWVWWIMHVFFELKMMSIFSMLFGAGIALVAERAEKNATTSKGLHYRRMFWLLLIGLGHAYLIWYGDILVCYSICGMLLYWMRKRSVGTLWIMGLLLFAIPSLISLLLAVGVEYMSPAEIAELEMEWAPDEAHIQDELTAYRGSWLDQMPLRAKTAFMMQPFVNLILFFWRAGGLMLIGMALYKSAFLSARKRNVVYWAVAVISGAIGWSLVLWGIERNEAAGWEVIYSLSTGSQFNYWGSLLVALAYISIIALWFKSGLVSSLSKALQSVGQMALTNYLMQSVLMTFFCWGHGFSWMGELSRLEQVGIVVGIWVLQLVVSPIWLSYFRFGPCEWLWRTLTYWRKQPMLRMASE